MCNFLRNLKFLIISCFFCFGLNSSTLINNTPFDIEIYIPRSQVEMESRKFQDFHRLKVLILPNQSVNFNDPNLFMGLSDFYINIGIKVVSSIEPLKVSTGFDINLLINNNTYLVNMRNNITTNNNPEFFTSANFIMATYRNIIKDKRNWKLELKQIQ